jgi:secreted Zn-dependent insulinase-like peptidase
MVSITLSEEGVVNWQKIVAELFQSVGLLRYHCEKGLPRWIFDELQSIQEVSHRYDDEPSPEDLVENLAETMSPAYNMPAGRLLDGSALLFEYDPAAIKNLVDGFFAPLNSRLDLASTKFGRSADYDNIEIAGMNERMDIPLSDDLFDPKNVPPQEEPMFGTHYWCQSIPAALLQKWSDLSKPQLPPLDSRLSLPKKNDFVPSKFDLKPLPPADCDHPLLNCSVKLQIAVGKRKVNTSTTEHSNSCSWLR